MKGGKWIFRLILIGGIVGVSASLPLTVAGESLPDRSGQVFFMRHSPAPGTGDPRGMSLDDRSSQRNLSDAGRAQAVATGERLRADGVTEARVFSSHWWRCLETAELLGLGEVTTIRGLDSFWERRADRGEILAAFADFILAVPVDSPPLILVTHYVNIQAVTGRAVGSGEGFWISLAELQELAAGRR